MSDGKIEGQPGRNDRVSKRSVIPLVVLAVAVAVAGYLIDASAKSRASALEQRLASAEGRIDGLTSALADSQTRISHLETSAAADQSVVSAREAERKELTTTPSKYIQSLGVNIFNKGIVNNYSHAVTAKLKNASQFNVTEMRGLVEYRSKDGQLVGSAPVQVTGTLLAGQTATLSLTAGEVTGASDPSRSVITVQSLTILGGS